tara:strand:+ start:226 stop:906 length:681 start_codon:yes stop_codon:yes gene_type:complete
MSIKNKYSVDSIPKHETYDWLLYKHYAKRLTNIQYSFGLFDIHNKLIGVCTFGIPAVSQWKDDYLELNRLCIDSTEKNILSFFVSQCLKKVSNKRIIVSFSDPNQNHNGYIYQATNWIYTGIGSNTKKYTLNGRDYHPRHLNKSDDFFIKLVKPYKIDINKNTVDEIWSKLGGKVEKQKGKHRYFYTKTKKQKNTILSKYKIYPYPKGQNKNYDASYKPKTQVKLF